MEQAAATQLAKAKKVCCNTDWTAPVVRGFFLLLGTYVSPATGAPDCLPVTFPSCCGVPVRFLGLGPARANLASFSV